MDAFELDTKRVRNHARSDGSSKRSNKRFLDQVKSESDIMQGQSRVIRAYIIRSRVSFRRLDIGNIIEVIFLILLVLSLGQGVGLLKSVNS